MRDPSRRLNMPWDEALVPLTVARNEIDAEMIATRLRSRGIECLVKIEDDLRAATRALGVATWAYPVCVLEGDIDRAQEVLSEIGHTPPAAEPRTHQIEAFVGSVLVVALSLVLALLLLTRYL